MKKKIEHTECMPEELEIKMRKICEKKCRNKLEQTRDKKRKAREKKRQTEYERRKTRMKTRSTAS